MVRCFGAAGGDESEAAAVRASVWRMRILRGGRCRGEAGFVLLGVVMIRVVVVIVGDGVNGRAVGEVMSSEDWTPW